jgi:nicotinate-nucleotide adenylyltransferase
MTQRPIALFGGTFDPIHLGHTGVALAAAAQIGAERVIFVQARCSPLKGFAPHASDADRLAMIELAIAGNDLLGVSDCELRRPAPSYTLETVRLFKKQFGPDRLIHWLLGADTVNDLVHWYKILDLIDECHLTTMQRGGYEMPDFGRFEPIWGLQRVAKLKHDVIQTPRIDVSSTRVRQHLAAGESVEGMLHPAVIEYTRQHGLYR